MLKLKDIHSLTEFQRNAKKHLRRLRQSGRPEVLTVNGQAELVVQSADAYQKIIDDLELLQDLKGIGRGLDQARRGQGKPARAFLKTLAGRHGISLEK
ncbi:MAG TPA: type II toxin-antitoxin system Phd/YefM family antitoxin [Humisphaera sp.]|jgi:PHD/YefM family antitoxin component YafN of YafNO toxin-antitoxin module|nr:type II toxin-antitoxin system Phd/YefM family antitoxin [Humisphaera sp.]